MTTAVKNRRVDALRALIAHPTTSDEEREAAREALKRMGWKEPPKATPPPWNKPSYSTPTYTPPPMGEFSWSNVQRYAPLGPKWGVIGPSSVIYEGAVVTIRKRNGEVNERVIRSTGPMTPFGIIGYPS